MAVILQMVFSDAFSQMPFREWKVLYFDKKNSLKFVPKGAIDNKAALVEIMACRLFGAKP